VTGDDLGHFLARLSGKLAAAGVPYMVVGSFASSFHGVPRGSQDLDLVIDPNLTSLALEELWERVKRTRR
jgi:hypothetical protein